MVLVLLLTSSLAAHEGVFIDPNHYIGSGSFAGTRYLAEETHHQLTLIGTTAHRPTRVAAITGPCGHMTTIGTPMLKP